MSEEQYYPGFEYSGLSPKEIAELKNAELELKKEEQRVSRDFDGPARPNAPEAKRQYWITNGVIPPDPE